MNRNVESHFSSLPRVDIQRSIFDRSSRHLTSLNAGDLVPIYVDEVLPGDTWKMTTSKVVRLQTLLAPVMDNAYLDTYWFYVPMRLTWEHTKQFFGENTESAWIPETEYFIPKIKTPDGGFNSGTIADYFGIPVGVELKEGRSLPSALPFRAYALICNEFFRSEVVTDPLHIPLGDATQDGSNGSDFLTDVVNGGMPFKVAKYHDYFTSCLPSPQRGEPVTFDITLAPFSGEIPVYTKSEPWPHESLHPFGLRLDTYSVPASSSQGWSLATDPQGNPRSYFTTSQYSGDFNYSSLPETSGKWGLYIPSNLAASVPDIGPLGTSISINDLRRAFQVQKFLERSARGGGRYTEFLKSHFGVTSPDGRLQRPEYLGGNRVPLNISQVTNNSQSEQDFLGDLGAMSHTSDVHVDFEKSFTEHGFVIGVCAIRYDHTYTQGLERFWTRSQLYDFYDPLFASLGEQPVYTSEIYLDPAKQDDVFGYQEAWADYRYKPNRCSSEMRPGISNSLASWHFADYYSEAPTLSDGWLREDKTNIDRTLAVTSQVSNQAFADFYFQCITTRPMPMYSIPGLIDHH